MPKDGKYGKVTLERKPEAPDDEPVFVLRAQDILAPMAVQAYADAVERVMVSDPDSVHAETVRIIRGRAEEMIAWRSSHGGGKLPD